MNTSANLDKLAEYIEANVEQSALDMEWFRLDDNNRHTEYFSEHNCGTSGCALGYAPFVKGLEPIADEFSEKTGALKFHDYCNRVFPDFALDSVTRHVTGHHHSRGWYEVFDAELSSTKSEVIQRLRDKANELRELA